MPDLLERIAEVESRVWRLALRVAGSGEPVVVAEEVLPPSTPDEPTSPAMRDEGLFVAPPPPDLLVAWWTARRAAPKKATRDWTAGEVEALVRERRLVVRNGGEGW